MSHRIQVGFPYLGWWFQRFFVFIPKFGKWTILTCAYFSDGLKLNHQLVLFFLVGFFFAEFDPSWDIMGGTLGSHDIKGLLTTMIL